MTIGELTLKKRHQFTQYGEHAAWTDYVTCDPQTVPLRVDNGRYWALATFDGVLTESSYPTGSRNVGQAQKAGLQTQLWGGVGHWIDSDLFHVEITDPKWELSAVGTYGDDCGALSGKSIIALRPARTMAEMEAR